MLIKEECDTEGMQIRKNSKSGGRRRKASRTPASTAYRSPEELGLSTAEANSHLSRDQIRYNLCDCKIRGKKDRTNYAA